MSGLRRMWGWIAHYIRILNASDRIRLLDGIFWWIFVIMNRFLVKIIIQIFNLKRVLFLINRGNLIFIERIYNLLLRRKILFQTESWSKNIGLWLVGGVVWLHLWILYCVGWLRVNFSMRFLICFFLIEIFFLKNFGVIVLHVRIFIVTFALRVKTAIIVRFIWR